MYKIIIDSSVEKVISKWKKSNQNLHKKLLNILYAISENPREGIGHPEPLIGGKGRIYSRHITARDRIIYEIMDEEIIVIVFELEGHYTDK